MEVLYMDEKLLLCCYNICKDNGNNYNVSVFLDDLIEYFESSKNVDKNNVLNILLYLKNGE
jgi:hypothetical protein